MQDREDGLANSGPRTIIAYAGQLSRGTRGGSMKQSTKAASSQRTKPQRTPNYYGERLRPRKQSNDLWNTVQTKRAKEKAAAGGCRVQSLNLETRGLLGLNKKDRNHFDTVQCTRDQTERMSKPGFWNGAAHGNMPDYETLLGAYAADLKRGM